VSVTWTVTSSIYYSAYDWSLIFREIGDRRDNLNMFYKTRHTLERHIRNDPGWFPRNETLHAGLEGLAPDTYYEICLAAVERGAVYYVHRANCKEVRTPKDGLSLAASVQEWERLPQAVTSDVAFAPSADRITVSWNVTSRDEAEAESFNQFSVVREISLRRFGNESVTRLFVLEDFNSTEDFGPRFYALKGLETSTSYVVCFDTLFEEDLRKRQEVGESGTTAGAAFGGAFYGDKIRRTEGSRCEEISTGHASSGLSKGQVAAATAVATSTTVFVVALICCCCFPGMCGFGKGNSNEKEKRRQKNHSDDEEEGSRDLNDNRHTKENEVVSSDTGVVTILVGDGNEERESADGVSAAEATGADGGASSPPSFFRDRYATATVPRVRAADGAGKFWLSCLPGQDGGKDANSSLYSHYDVTVHSRADEDQQRGHHHHRHRHRRSFSDGRRHSSPADLDDGNAEEDSHRQGVASTHSSTRRSRKHHSHSPKRRAPQPPTPSSGEERPAAGLYFENATYPLALMGPGSYHTVSSYQFQNRRPHTFYAYPEYYPQVGLLATSSVQQQHQQQQQPRGFRDYPSKTLGRYRRPQQQHHHQREAMELRPFAGFGGAASNSADAYKMFTWSPYAHSYADYSLRLREPLMGQKGQKRPLDELRF